MASCSPHFITQLHYAVLVGLDRREMERDVSVEPFEERDPISDQDRQDGIIDFVGQPQAEALAGDRTTADEPDGAKPRPQAPVHEPREIARAELDGVPS